MIYLSAMLFPKNHNAISSFQLLFQKQSLTAKFNTSKKKIKQLYTGNFKIFIKDLSTL